MLKIYFHYNRTIISSFNQTHTESIKKLKNKKPAILVMDGGFLLLVNVKCCII